MHANALGKLINSWPVIVPPSPGVLCAYGDATTRLRDEASMTFIRMFKDTSNSEVRRILQDLRKNAAKALDAENVPRSDQTAHFQVDVRYHGQGLMLTVDVELKSFDENGLDTAARRFDKEHTQMFTFALDVEHEIVNLRAVVQGKASTVKARRVAKGGDDPPREAKLGTSKVYVENKERNATIYDRRGLRAGNKVVGPAIITEMDSTTLIMPKHYGEVDRVGNILIRPVN